MKRLYLILAIVGFIIPNIFVFNESVLTGNVFLWLDPKATIKTMFATNINSAFASDLLFVVLVFFVWTYHQSMRYRIKNVWYVWILTLVLGLAGSFPLFLYIRESQRKKRKGTSTKTKRMKLDEG